MNAHLMYLMNDILYTFNFLIGNSLPCYVKNMYRLYTMYKYSIVLFVDALILTDVSCKAAASFCVCVCMYVQYLCIIRMCINEC